PQSFNEVNKVIAELPSYTKQFNSGKGVPIEYTLYPLSELKKQFTQDITVNSMIMELSEDTILTIEQVFDDLLESKQRLNDLYNDAQSDHMPDMILDEINVHVKDVIIEEARFRRELAECLMNVRSGKSSI